jgi:hypothetical protein
MMEDKKGGAHEKHVFKFKQIISPISEKRLSDYPQDQFGDSTSVKSL